VILGSRVLFVHVPKTGGMAVTRYLLAALPRPVWYSHPDRDPTLDDGVVQVKGIRHETLAESFAIAARHGIDAARLPLLIGVLRNPYALEVSRFAYLQKGHAWDAGPNQDLALAGDFTAFATQSTDHGGSERPIEAYFQIDGRVPPTMRILRQESLHDQLPRTLRDAGIEVPGTATLAAENESRHGPWLDYYTRAAAEAVAARYRWVFDRGFYDRLDPATLPEHRETPFHGVRVATSGPIRQAGPIVGLWHDGWTERRLVVPLVAEADLPCIVVHGHSPHAFPGGLHLSARAGGAAVEHVVTTPTPFSMQVPAACRCGDRLRLTLDASASFHPQDGGGDTRHLSWVLSRIAAEPTP